MCINSDNHANLCNLDSEKSLPDDTFLQFDSIIIRLSPKRQCSRQEVMERDGRCKWTQHQLVCHPLGHGSDMTSVFDRFHAQIHVSFQFILIYLRFCVGSEVNLTACVRFTGVSYQDDSCAAFSPHSLSAFLSLCLQSLLCYCSHR